MTTASIARTLGLAAAFGLTATSACAADELSTRAYSILEKNCFACHGAAKMSGLDLRSADTVRAGGKHGPAVVPSRPDESRLYRMVSHALQPSMPPGGKLPDGDLETLRSWIGAGASLEGFSGLKADANKIEERPFTAAERAYWAFQAPKQARLPGSNAIDGYLQSAMKAKGLKASPKADRRTLIRRAYLDLTGLPPTPEEVDAFVQDASRDAWPKLVDKLLALPHYGERWARHWLDLVRFADSDGFEFDRDRPDRGAIAITWFSAFNSDKPYDRFIKEQLAGDEYASPDDPAATQERMIATGYLRLGPSGGGGGERGKQDSLDDIIATTSMTFLGLTVGCARCHDHKFDPHPAEGLLPHPIGVLSDAARDTSPGWNGCSGCPQSGDRSFGRTGKAGSSGQDRSRSAVSEAP